MSKIERQRLPGRLMTLVVAMHLVFLSGACGTLIVGGPPTVTVNEATFMVRVADSAAERRRGLSQDTALRPQTGMVFIHEGGESGEMWMKDMLFPIDFIWIGVDCRVVDIRSFAPIPGPGTPDHQLPRYAPSTPAHYTLEINAGEAEGFGIRVGDRVSMQNVNGVGCPAGANETPD